MAGLNVAGTTGLKFTAKLDISDAKKNADELKKIYADLKIQSSGITSKDTSGLDVQKTATQGLNDAIKEQRLLIVQANAAKAEDNAQIIKNKLALQEQTIATKAQLAAEKELAAQHTVPVSTGFPSGSGGQEFANSTPIPGGSAISGTAKNVELLNKDLQDGVITAAEFKAAMDQISESQAYFAQKTAATVVPIEEEIGIIEGLKLAIKDLNAQRIGIALESDLPILNKELQETQIALAQASNVGKIGFDEFGNKIKAVSVEMEKPIGQYNRLAYAAKLYEQQSKTSTNPDIIAKYNAKLQDAQIQLAQIGNVGKKGFDELGNAVGKSTGFFSSAWTGLRKLAQILPGIGVAGIIAFATEPIINYLSTMGILSDKLTKLAQQLRDQASLLQSVISVRESASKASEGEISTLDSLYKATQNLKLSYQDRLNAAVQLQNLYPSTLGNLSTEAILAGKGAEAYNALKQSILDVAYASAISTKIGANQSRRLADDLEITKQQTEQLRLQKVLQQSDINYKTATTATDQAKAYAYNITAQADLVKSKKAEADADKDRQLIDKQNLDLETRRDNLIKKRGSNVLTGGVNVASSQNQAQLENQKIQLNIDIETQNAISDNQKKSDADRIASLKKALDDQIKIININATEQVSNTKLSNAEKKNISDQANAERLKATNEYQKKIDAITNKTDRSGNSQAKADAASLKAKIDLLQQISDATQAFNRKALTADQQSLTNISDKFDQLRKKIAIFNADPKNKNNQISQTVVTELNTQENTDITDQANLNENKYIEQDIEKKKKLYADYEAYRLKVGDTIANADYADLLKSGKDLQTYLLNLQAGFDPNDQSGPMQQRREATQKELDATVEAQKVALQKLKEEYASYEQQKEALIQSAQTKEAELNLAGDRQGAAQVQKDLNDQLTALGEANFKKLDSYKYLFDNINTLTEASAKKQIDALYGQAAVSLAVGKISAAAYINIIKTLDSANTTINDKLPHGLEEIGSAMSNLGSAAGQFDEGLGKALSTAGQLVSAVGSIKGNLNTINSSSSTSFDKISSGLGLVSTAFGIISSVVGLFDHSKEAAEQAAYSADLQAKAIQAVNTELQRQLELTKQVYGPDRITDYIKQLKDIQTAQAADNSKLAGKVSLTGDKVVDDAIAKFNSGATNKIKVGLSDITAQVQASFGLAGKSIADLQKLLDDGKLDASVATIVQSLIDLQQQAIDTQNALTEELTGTSLDDLTSSIVDLFQNATTSAQDFSDNFQKVIQTGILNAFKRDYLEKQLQTFYDDFDTMTAAANGNILTANDIATLQNEYNTILNNANSQFQNIEKATGIVFGDPTAAAATNTTSTLSNAIKGITADQADLLAGQFGGFRLAQLQTNVILTKNADFFATMAQSGADRLIQLIAINANTYRTANNTDVLSNIDKSLTTIAKNTGAPSSSLIANGKVV